MSERPANGAMRRNLLLMGAAGLFVALAVVLCLALRPKGGQAGSFVIRSKTGETVTVAEDETRTVVVRDGRFADEATGEGDENVIRIENGRAWMEHANCPHGECMEQGVLCAETAKTRPLGAWIICMPHGVTVEYREGGA